MAYDTAWQIFGNLPQDPMKRSRAEASSPPSEARSRKRKKKKKKKKQKRQGNKDTAVANIPKDGRSNWNSLKRKMTHANNNSTT